MSSMSSWTMLRSIQNSERVNQHKVSRGTTRRILSFARPYRRDIVVFLITVVLDAVIGVATPVLAGHVVVTIVWVMVCVLSKTVLTVLPDEVNV